MEICATSVQNEDMRPKYPPTRAYSQKTQRVGVVETRHSIAPISSRQCCSRAAAGSGFHRQPFRLIQAEEGVACLSRPRQHMPGVKMEGLIMTHLAARRCRAHSCHPSRLSPNTWLRFREHIVLRRPFAPPISPVIQTPSLLKV